MRCPTGEARLTLGFALLARYVIHTVGPVWHGGNQGEPELLRAAYRNSFNLAATAGLRSIAFPAISTGVYRYPTAAAAEIALDEALSALSREPCLLSVLLVAFNDDSVSALEHARFRRLPAGA